MMPISLRLSWATRSTDGRGVLVLVAAAGALGFGAVLSAASRNDQSFLLYWCSAVATACLIGVDFPGTGHPRWSEFELSLPIAPMARARAQLLLSLAIWLSPSLVACALSQLGAFGVKRLPPYDALGAFGNAAACVVFATAVRHTLALQRSLGATALRLLTAPVMLVAASGRSPVFGTVVLILATPLLAMAHRAASRPPELLPTPIAAPPALGPIESPRPETSETRRTRTAELDVWPETTFGGLALRYCAGGAYPLMVLVMLGLWAFGINAGWLQAAAPHTMLLAMLVVSYAMWGTRLLRLGHLPYSRERLLRYVAWLPLAAIAIGLGASLFLAAPEQLLRHRVRVQNDVTVSALQSPVGAWQLTTAEPPLVTAPNGESHRPSARAFGLGSLLVAYDPYEIPRGASHAFRLYQAGRLLEDQRGLSLPPERLEQRFGAALDRNLGLSSDRFPELQTASPLGKQLAGAAALLVVALLAMHVVIRPGAGYNPNRIRSDVPYMLLSGLFLVSQLLHLASLTWFDGADPTAIVLSRIGRPLAESALLVVPVAAGLGLLLYRSLIRRFAQMEPPQRAKTMDAWFVEI